jgi:hypothetical protein
VIDGQLVLLLRQGLEVVLGDQDQQVARDDLFGVQAVGREVGGLGQHGPIRRLIGGATIGAEVRPAVVETLVAQHGGPQRVPFQHAVPEAVGEVVDGSVGISDDGHSWALLKLWGTQAGSGKCSATQLPNRSASSAAGVSSSWS